MQRSFVLRTGFKAGKLVGAGIYDEDLTNNYKTTHIKHNNRMQNFYADNEFQTAMRLVEHRARYDSFAQHEGRDPITGYGAFERELERKGIPVDKYPLPNTVQATRVREMTLLRRLKLEEKSSEIMKGVTEKKRREIPSEWYDESKGPLNPHYLKFVKNQYSKIDVTALPNDPITHSEVSRRVAALKE